jgi:hypothetical protein
MSDNILQTLQQLVQDVIAPDVRELKVRMTSLEKQVDVRFNAMEQRFDMFEQKSDAQFKTINAQFHAVLSALSESKAQMELNNFRLVAALSERVAVLEAQRH